MKKKLFITDISKMISRDRFYTINRYFSILNYSSDIKTPLVILEDKTQRINKFIEHCNKLWKQAYKY